MSKAARALVATVGVAALLLALAGPASGESVYVVNGGSEDISVIDTHTDAVTGTIPVGGPPLGLTFGPGGTTGYVADAIPHGLAILDTASGTITGSIPIANPNMIPFATTIAPDGHTAYVTNAFSFYANEVDLTSGSVVGSPFYVGGEVDKMAISPDGRTGYMASGQYGTVTVIDLATKQVVTQIATGVNSPAEPVVSSDGSAVYVGARGTKAIVVIDTATNQVEKTIPIEGGGDEGNAAIGDLTLSPDGRTLWFDRPTKDAVERIDTQTDQVVGSPIHVAKVGGAMTITPDGRTLYVVGGETNAVSTIDIATERQTGKPIPVGKEPRDIAVGSSPLSSLAVSIVNSRSGVRRGRAQIGIFCNGANGTRCRGRISLTLFVRSRAHPRRPKTLALGHRGYQVDAGSSTYFAVPLNRKGRRLVNRFGHLRVRAAASLEEGDPAARKVIFVAPS